MNDKIPKNIEDLQRRKVEELVKDAKREVVRKVIKKLDTHVGRYKKAMGDVKEDDLIQPEELVLSELDILRHEIRREILSDYDWMGSKMKGDNNE